MNKYVRDAKTSGCTGRTFYVSWKGHESKLLPEQGVVGTVDEQYSKLLEKYDIYEANGYPQTPKVKFEDIDYHVRLAVRDWSTFGTNSGADPVHGADDFTDSDGFYYPDGKNGQPKLGDYNDPTSKYYNPGFYYKIVENRNGELDAFKRKFISVSGAISQTYKMDTDNRGYSIYAFTVFQYR